MAQLIFIDGKQLNVPYEKAAKIKQVLDGLEEPEDEEQAAFVCKIADIRFDKLPKPRAYRNPRGLSEEQKLERREKITKIMADPKLKGIQKVQAISKLLGAPHK